MQRLCILLIHGRKYHPMLLILLAIYCKSKQGDDIPSVNLSPIYGCRTIKYGLISDNLKHKSVNDGSPLNQMTSDGINIKLNIISQCKPRIITIKTAKITVTHLAIIAPSMSQTLMKFSSNFLIVKVNL